MTRLALHKDIIQWAIARSGLDPQKLDKRFPRLNEWISGDLQPTLKQVEKFAKATFTPFGYFFLSNPPEEQLPVPHYRTLKDSKLHRPSADLLETIQTMERRQSWMREFLINDNSERLPFVGSASVDSDPVTVAKQMRESIGFKEDWAADSSTWTDALKTLREAIEASGVLVVVNGIVGNNTHRKLNPDEFRGFVLIDHYAPLVFVNGADFKAAQMFTLAHELAHVFLGQSAAFDLRDTFAAQNALELKCNKIAAEFLVPEKALRAYWPEIRNASNAFQKIANRFKVSGIVAARRVFDLNLVSKEIFIKFYKTQIKESAERASLKDESGGDFYRNQNLRVGRRFASAIIVAAKEGKLLYSDAYDLTGLNGKTFDKYAGKLMTQRE